MAFSPFLSECIVVGKPYLDWIKIAKIHIIIEIQMIIITIVKKNLTVAKCPKKLNGTQMMRMKRIFAGFN